MANITDYVTWRGEFDLSVSPFNDIDALILTQMAMVDLTGIVPGDLDGGEITLSEAARLYFSDTEREIAPYSVIIPAETYVLFKKCAESKRFGDVRLAAHVNHIDTDKEKQFSAFTWRLPDGRTVVTFRGTDDTLVGWKEDMNLSFMSAVPAQKEALAYLERMAARFEGELTVAGHSKGGNLSIYSAVKCADDIRRRITTVYNFDAPGFSKRFIALPEYAEVKKKTKTYLPQTAIVGRLLESSLKYTVVRSFDKGVMQHNAFTWEVEGDNFVTLPDLTRASKNIRAVMVAWLSRLDARTRKTVADAIYSILVATDSTTVTELCANRRAIFGALKATSPRERAVVIRALIILFGESGKLAAKRFMISVARRFEAFECKKLKKHINVRKKK